MTSTLCNCRIRSLCTKCPCDHSEVVSDKSICPSPCDQQHTYCLDCGDALELCHWD